MNTQAPETATQRAGCGKFMRVPGTNGGGMKCGATLHDLAGVETVRYCPDCNPDKPATLEEQTAAEVRDSIAAGCEQVTPAEYRRRIESLGYKVVDGMGHSGVARMISGDSAGRQFKTRTWYVVEQSTGLHWPNVDANRDRLEDLQALRRGVVAVSRGRIIDIG